jgi:hypothetical protein
VLLPTPALPITSCAYLVIAAAAAAEAQGRRAGYGGGQRRHGIERAALVKALHVQREMG